jgi:hypothetical protein
MVEGNGFEQLAAELVVFLLSTLDKRAINAQVSCAGRRIDL